MGKLKVWKIEMVAVIRPENRKNLAKGDKISVITIFSFGKRHEIG